MATTIGDRVKLKQNNLNGKIKFIGEIKGKYGIWYGIELDRKRGSTDGSIRNISYFKTKKNKGIFVKDYEILNTINRNQEAPRCSVGDTVKIKQFGCNGTIRYIGDTDFKHGTWYGVELKKPKGKNNGTVNNRLYFQCKYKYGAFVKAQSIIIKNNNIPNNAHKKEIKHQDIAVTIGDKVQLRGDKLIGTIKFIGYIMGKKGIFYGIELNGSKGKNDGSVQGIYYFKCRKYKNKGIFVTKNKIMKRINIIDSGGVRVTAGDRVRVKHVNCNGVVRYIGTPHNKNGIWYGIELDEAKGKNNGVIKDRVYFKCNENCGIFVRAGNIGDINEVLMNEVDGDDIKDDIKEIDDVDNDNVEESIDNVEEIKECDFKAADISEYVVDYDHVKIEVKDFCDTMKVDGKKHNGEKLLKIFDKIKVKEKDLSLWGGYWGNKLFKDKTDARNRLKTVIDFAEKNSACSKHINQKLRVITKLIIKKGTDRRSEYVHILLLLASHGNVCNVMKEVAIGNAYGLMTDKLDDFVKEQSLEQQINKVLRDYRVLLVEVLFHSFGMQNNTHYIASFHNILAKDIGVTPYNDPNICTPSSTRCKGWRKNLDKRYFKTLYTKSNIIKHVLEQIKEKKIGYQNVVKFMEDKCPKDVHKIAFLQQAIDIDTGKIDEDYICWILEKLGIFMMKPGDWKPIKKCWDNIKAN